MAAPDGQAVKASRLSGSSRPVGSRFASRSRHAVGAAARLRDLRWCHTIFAGASGLGPPRIFPYLRYLRKIRHHLYTPFSHHLIFEPFIRFGGVFYPCIKSVL